MTIGRPVGGDWELCSEDGSAGIPYLTRRSYDVVSDNASDNPGPIDAHGDHYVKVELPVPYLAMVALQAAVAEWRKRYRAERAALAGKGGG
jgi:hypothetical protein